MAGPQGSAASPGLPGGCRACPLVAGKGHCCDPAGLLVPQMLPCARPVVLPPDSPQGERLRSQGSESRTGRPGPRTLLTPFGPPAPAPSLRAPRAPSTCWQGSPCPRLPGLRPPLAPPELAQACGQRCVSRAAGDRSDGRRLRAPSDAPVVGVTPTHWLWSPVW